jgi:hypothetical protein
MNLMNIVAGLDSFDQELTIYAAKPWTCDSSALVEREPDSGGIPPEGRAAGLHYFIEMFVAKEFLNDWMASERREIPLRERCERLIHCAIYDA